MNALEYLSTRNALHKLATPCPVWGKRPYCADAFRRSRFRPCPAENTRRVSLTVSRETLHLFAAGLLVAFALVFLAGVKWSEHCQRAGIGYSATATR